MGKLVLEEQADPDTPSANKVAIFPKAGGGVHKKDDAGKVVEFIAGEKVVDATLSGVPVILTVVIGGVTYHWKAYPTKA